MTELERSLSWQSMATCRNQPAEWWFPVKGKSLDTTEYAKDVCRRECPVRLECLLWALRNHEQFGIWGGYSHLTLRRFRCSLAYRTCHEDGCSRRLTVVEMAEYAAADIPLRQWRCARCRARRAA